TRSRGGPAIGVRSAASPRPPERSSVRRSGVVMSRFPFGIPFGWYPVAWSFELEKGGVLRRHYFSRELVVFRGESGEAFVLDAYCPHVGAHLGVGGRVEGETLRCPFHGWRFSGAGECVEIPYAKRTPGSARAFAFPVR